MSVVSIDFDYFIRETLAPIEHIDPRWHNFYELSSFDLFAETDIERFADFRPEEIAAILRKKGLNLDRMTKIARASEHGKAYDFLKGKSIKLLVNFDAHHDMHNHNSFGNRPAEKIEEGNWLYFLRPEGTIYIVYPKWCIAEKLVPEPETKRNVRIVTIENLPCFNQHVDYLFVCRSDNWAPPHHDETFQEMFSILLAECDKKNFKNYGANSPRYWEYKGSYQAP